MKKILNKICTKKIDYIDDIEYVDYYLWNKIPIISKKLTYNSRKTYICKLKVSKRKIKDPYFTNELDLEQTFLSKEKPCKRSSIDIIIPIYNGFDYLPNLFNSLLQNTDLDYRLIVINDCSTDERIKPFLNEQQKKFKSKIILIENETNLGFVKTTNIGLKISNNHVALINTDVQLPPNWASRLFHPIFSNDKIASVTPFSNAATIFSLPNSCQNNILDGDFITIDKAISKLKMPPEEIELPTGMGFCMAINKKTLKEIGDFDEIFESGYGEENDWCQRAINNGFINVIASNLFVWHKHGGSFDSKTKKQLIKNHCKILKSRYKYYHRKVGDLKRKHHFMSLRFFAELLYANAVANSSEVWFDHTWKGGTETYTFNKIEELKNENLILRIQGTEKGDYILTYFYKDYKNRIAIKSLNELEIVLKQLNFGLLVVNNLASYSDIPLTLKFISKLKQELNIKVSFRGHDFQCICPSLTLTNSKYQFCNCQNRQTCLTCFNTIIHSPITYNSIEKWQNHWQEFINNTADEIILFSNSTKNIFLRFFPNSKNKIKIIPHNINPIRKVNIKKHKTINIGILGEISHIKGALILKEIDGLLDEYKNITIKIIGKCSIKKFKHIKILGRYKVKQLPEIIEKHKIDSIFIPSIWPETFSYTTGEAMAMGLPVACFDIGAPAERVKNYSKGIIIPKIDAQLALKQISQKIMEQRELQILNN